MGRGAQTEKGENPENKKIGRCRLARGKRAQPVKKAKLWGRCFGWAGNKKRALTARFWPKKRVYISSCITFKVALVLATGKHSCTR